MCRFLPRAAQQYHGDTRFRADRFVGDPARRLPISLAQLPPIDCLQSLSASGGSAKGNNYLPAAPQTKPTRS